MGAQQVLRPTPIRRLVTSLAVATAIVAAGIVAPGVFVATALAQAPKNRRPALADERIAVIDLRVLPDKERFLQLEDLYRQLGGVGGIVPIVDTSLRAALVARPDPAPLAAAMKQLAEASRLYGKLDCSAASKAANAAVNALAALQARGDDVTGDLVRAYAYILLCADRDGDVDRSAAAITRLRALGLTKPPDGINPNLWRKFPSLDATSNLMVAELEVVSTGAQLWIDHKLAGQSSVKVFLPAGEHLVAASDGARSRATTAMVGGKETKVEVTLDSVDLPHAQIISTITAFRIGSKRLTASSIGQLLDALDVRFALVLTPTEKQQVWSKRSKKSKSALLVGTARDALEIGALVGEQRNDWSGPGIDPDVPLLREDPGDRRRGKGAKNPLKWWFYASIIGAVGLGAAFIIASDLADDKQRVEVTFP